MDDQWISVDENTPTQSDFVLVYGYSPKHNKKDVFQAYFYANGESKSGPRWVDMEWRPINRVSHWMPLPAPPAQEKALY